MSGFLAVNSLVNACMRIMSGLFTVAIVRVVCAMAGAEPNRVTAPSRALRTCLTVTSLRSFFALSICPRIAIMFTPSRGLVKDRNSEAALALQRGRTARQCFASRTAAAAPAGARASNRSLRLQNGACRRLVGDQPVDQAAFQRSPDGRDLGSTDGRADRQGLGGDPRRNAGDAAVDSALDEAALGVECPTGHFADGAQPHHFQQFLT